MRVLLPALAAGAAARSHRVAVLVSGTRSYTNATWDSLKTHVLDALEARGTAYEAFACGEPGQAVPSFATEVAASHATPEARLAACYAAAVRLRRPSLFCPSVCYSGPSPARHRRDTRREAESDRPPARHRRDAAQVGKAAPRPRRWGPPRASPPPFTHFLKTRPDHLWHAPPPILSRLPDAHVALRARVLVGHVRVSSDAMSWHGCGLRDGDLRPLCEDGPASLKPDGANACLVLDDQVALVPACAADAFFFGGRGTPRRAHECKTQPEGASDLRLTWNEKTSVSFPRPLVTLGLWVLVDVFSVAVAEPAERFLASAPSPRHPTHSLICAQAWGDGRGGAWRKCPKPSCWGGGHETTLTRHCARRRLPLVIAAFRVRPTAARHSLVGYPARERFFSCNASDGVLV